MADPLKQFMQQNVSLPLSIEASLPQGVPQISGLMASFAQALPENPVAAALAGGNGKQQNLGLPFMSGFNDIIKGVEGVLPQGVPSLQNFGMGPYRDISTEPEKPMKGPLMRGGYRSIST